jgi:hypothetical protein
MPASPRATAVSDAHVEDVRRRRGPAVLAHRYLYDGGSAAAWASTCAIIRATLAGSARSAASFHSLRCRLLALDLGSSASLTTADTDGALPVSTRCSAYAARWGSIVTVRRAFRSLIPGSYDGGAPPGGRRAKTLAAE